MKSLPIEVLIKILSHFPQRYILTVLSTICKEWNNVINQHWLFSTLHIYNKRQLKRIAQLVENKRTINNKPIEFYVQRLIFDYEYSLKKGDINILSAFPNLQHIDGLTDYYKQTYNNKAIYIQPQQPTKFSYFPEDGEWTKKFNSIKSNLKTLNIYLFDEVLDNKSVFQKQEQQSEKIGLKIIEQWDIYPDSPTVVLMFPNLPLANLIGLKIDFTCSINNIITYPPEYIIDQHTFENIHQTFPLLELLSMECFFMYISNEYYKNNKSNIISALRLKNLNKEEKFLSQFCFLYFATIYPDLESLSLYESGEGRSRSVSNAKSIVNMLFQLSSLKKLSYKKINPCSDDEFFKWLNIQSNKLTHLELKRCHSKNNFIIANKDEEIIPPIQQHFNYLIHLTSLSFDLNNATDIAFTFLSENNNTTIISTIMKKIKILYVSKSIVVAAKR
ncbi:unnamed protein product [Cunninghamella blakesleeana]